MIVTSLIIGGIISSGIYYYYNKDTIAYKILEVYTNMEQSLSIKDNNSRLINFDYTEKIIVENNIPLESESLIYENNKLFFFYNKSLDDYKKITIPLISINIKINNQYITKDLDISTLINKFLIHPEHSLEFNDDFNNKMMWLLIYKEFISLHYNKLILDIESIDYEYNIMDMNLNEYNCKSFKISVKDSKIKIEVITNK